MGLKNSYTGLLKVGTVCCRVKWHSNEEIGFQQVRKHYWLPAFSPFPAIFTKSFILRIIQTGDCVLKG